jgi:hypothetical protein
VHERDAFDGSDHALLGAHEGRWASVAAAHDRALLHGADGAHAPALGDALRRNSELHLLQAYLHGIRGSSAATDDAASPQLAELQAECAWRTGHWSYDAVPTARPSGAPTFSSCCTVRWCRWWRKTHYAFERALRGMRALAARRLSLTSVESTEHVYAQLHRLACVNELERVWRVRVGDAGARGVDGRRRHAAGAARAGRALRERRGGAREQPAAHVRRARAVARAAHRRAAGAARAAAGAD